ncbi:uncharacterized protein EURHEDRAFT_13459 [Aspergillus ruber CBS 135680]|uniref:Uncharacterized protein n=1 Tax=Aspergillus ruber (strain CBS 135680) TaxID=1388766 RepID=A0A017SS29_ASPRC|nr:uncharacterized protein EURHEDRAFT_13459 [Aspergillus ruber CBS 135680]EYE99404.1 hypothetical protein EURHEDRAFT_13459 [Aspergillus ruber CBS 135680]
MLHVCIGSDLYVDINQSIVLGGSLVASCYMEVIVERLKRQLGTKFMMNRSSFR